MSQSAAVSKSLLKGNRSIKNTHTLKQTIYLAQENVLTIIIHQGNANQSHTSLKTHQMREGHRVTGAHIIGGSVKCHIHFGKMSGNCL